MDISDGSVTAVASGALKNKNGNLIYCTVLKCDSNMTVSGGKLHLVNGSAGGKCISSDHSLTISGGTIYAETTGDGAEYVNASEKTNYYTSKCIAASDSIIIISGSIECQSTGLGGKGIVSDNYMQIGADGGKPGDIMMRIATKGTCIINNKNEDLRFGCPKGIRVANLLKIYGGDILVSTKGQGGEGIESKGQMYVYGGSIECNTFDDGINVDKSIYIHDGMIYCISANNDGIDSNGSITIDGGLIVSKNRFHPNESLDSEGGLLTINGGTLFCIGQSQVKFQRCADPYYNTEWFYYEGKRIGSMLPFRAGQYVCIIDEKGKSVMSLLNENETSSGFITTTGKMYQAGKAYKICQGDKPSNPEQSFFGGRLLMGGTPGNLRHIKDIQITATP